MGQGNRLPQNSLPVEKEVISRFYHIRKVLAEKSGCKSSQVPTQKILNILMTELKNVWINLGCTSMSDKAILKKLERKFGGNSRTKSKKKTKRQRLNFNHKTSNTVHAQEGDKRLTGDNDLYDIAACHCFKQKAKSELDTTPCSGHDFEFDLPFYLASLKGVETPTVDEDMGEEGGQLAIAEDLGEAISRNEQTSSDVAVDESGLENVTSEGSGIEEEVMSNVSESVAGHGGIKKTQKRAPLKVLFNFNRFSSIFWNANRL